MQSEQEAPRVLGVPTPACGPGPMRGHIETRKDFVVRNLHWWRQNKEDRTPHYERFLRACNLPGRIQAQDLVLGEVGPGPQGGILGKYRWPARLYYFIDYMMEELLTLNPKNWPGPARFVNCPAEKMPIPTDRLQVLVSYNCLDHGWDVWKAMRECVRISHACYLSFDCRGQRVVNASGCPDLDHYQVIRFSTVRNFVQREFGQYRTCEVFDLQSKAYPVAVVIVEK